MRLSSIAHLYRVRLKASGVLFQELLAVLGLAAGVALLFASQISSASLNNSVTQLTRELVGQMQLQLDARAPGASTSACLARSGACPVFARLRQCSSSPPTRLARPASAASS